MPLQRIWRRGIQAGFWKFRHIRRHLGNIFPASQEVNGKVNADAMQPRSQRRVSPVAIHRRQSAQQCFVRQVFRIRFTDQSGKPRYKPPAIRRQAT